MGQVGLVAQVTEFGEALQGRLLEVQPEVLVKDGLLAVEESVSEVC